jgi:hypothetical protein
MKCQHCGSTDIVAIQGKDYCLNCGHTVTAPTKAEVKPAVTKKPATKAKRKPAKPKAAPKLVPPRVKVTPPPARELAPPVASRTFDLRPQQKKTVRPATPHPLRFSLSVAAVLGVIVAVAVGLVLGFQVDSDIGVYVIAACLVMLAVGSVLSQAALFYGLSKAHDRRPAPHAYWWAAARGGFMEIVNVDMLALIGGLLILAAGAAVWRLNAHEVALSQPVRAVGLALVNLLLAWLLLGVYVARRIGIPAVIVGGITAGEGFRVGWRLYARAGGHLVVAGLEALLGRILALLILAVGVYALAAAASSPNQLELVVGAAIGAGICIFVLVLVLLEWESRVWLRQYRRWVASFGPAERVRLLTGRAQPRS